MIFLYILFFIFIICIVFALISKKFENPYKVQIVLGLPGSGKTLKGVQDVLKFQKAGWNVYSNIELNIPGVRIFDPLDLSTCTPDADSFLFIDEAGILFDNRFWATFGKGLTAWFKKHRHYKAYVELNSQNWDMDLKIKGCCQTIYLQSNIGNIISICRPVKRVLDVAENQDSEKSGIVDKYYKAKIWNCKFLWMPKYYKYFNTYDIEPRPPLPYREVGSDGHIITNTASAAQSEVFDLSEDAVSDG